MIVRASVIFFHGPSLHFSSTLPFTCQLKVPDISSYKLRLGVSIKERDSHHYIRSIFFKKEGNILLKSPNYLH